MDLPSILTDAQVATFAAAIALLVGIAQSVSIIPIPEGSKARAIVVVVLAAAFVGITAPAAGLSGANLALGVALSFAALASAALGLNRAGTYTATTLQARVAGTSGEPPPQG